MKRIIFIINNMNTGGIQKALIELLKQIKDKYDLSLFVVSSSNTLIKEIPSSICVYYGNDMIGASELSLRQAKKQSLKVFLIKYICSIWSKIFSRRIPARILTHYYKIPGTYDYAVSYTQPVSSKFFF